MSIAKRYHYYLRIFSAYLGSGRSQLTFWHETPELNPRAGSHQLGEYYMTFREKADYPGITTPTGSHARLSRSNWFAIQSDRDCAVGPCELQPLLRDERQRARAENTPGADWLIANLEQNAHGLQVWNHHFDWEYRDTLKSPWYSGLAQGQGVSLLLRAHLLAHSRQSADRKYQRAAENAFVALTRGSQTVESCS